MSLQRVTLRLTELRCLAQTESDGSEPYLWTTFFAFGGQQLPFQTGPLATITPAYDAFRAEFPDHVKAGMAVPVPPFVASASFDLDMDTVPHPKIVGCIAVLMEEDSTPQSSIVLGRIAYAKAIDAELQALVNGRIRSGNFEPISQAEIDAIKKAVAGKVESAIASNQSIWNAFRDQDDEIGVSFKAFTDTEIRFQYFDLPDFVSGGNRFRLTGSLSLGPVPVAPVDLCARPRAALAAKQQEIAGLQARRSMLQSQLQHAAPAQKAALVAEINQTAALITQAEGQLLPLKAALDACQSRRPPGGVATGGTRPVVSG